MNGNGSDRDTAADALADALKRTRQGYRAAADAMDEQPSAQARAAILAAAARAVDARPRDVAAGSRLRTRPRWPMAAAATVLLSTLAVFVARQTEHEQQGAKVAEAAPPQTVARTVPIAPAEPAAPAEAAPPVAQAAPPAASEKAVAAAPIARLEEPVAADTQGAASRKPAPPAAPAPALPSLPALSGSVGNAVRSSGGPDPGGGPMGQPSAEERALSAGDWLAQIVRLREAGRHAEADAQLQRFRERYPQVRVPDQALPPASR